MIRGDRLLLQHEFLAIPIYPNFNPRADYSYSNFNIQLRDLVFA